MSGYFLLKSPGVYYCSGGYIIDLILLMSIYIFARTTITLIVTGFNESRDFRYNSCPMGTAWLAKSVYRLLDTHIMLRGHMKFTEGASNKDHYVDHTS